MNIPNILSLFRLCLVPAFIIIYFSGLQHSSLIAVAIFILASLTDVLDGMLARKLNKITTLGKILDPLGDKLMTASVLACITIDKIIPLWALIVLLIKEFLMGLGGLILYNKISDMPPANFIGKSSTVVFFIACVILMLFDNIPDKWSTAVICAALAVMSVAFTRYLFCFIKTLRKNNTHSTPDTLDAGWDDSD